MPAARQGPGVAISPQANWREASRHLQLDTGPGFASKHHWASIRAGTWGVAAGVVVAAGSEPTSTLTALDIPRTTASPDAQSRTARAKTGRQGHGHGRRWRLGAHRGNSPGPRKVGSSRRSRPPRALAQVAHKTSTTLLPAVCWGAPQAWQQQVRPEHFALMAHQHHQAIGYSLAVSAHQPASTAHLAADRYQTGDPPLELADWRQGRD